MNCHNCNKPIRQNHYSRTGWMHAYSLEINCDLPPTATPMRRPAVSAVVETIVQRTNDQDYMMDRHRTQWPKLWRALDRLVEEYNNV